MAFFSLVICVTGCDQKVGSSIGVMQHKILIIIIINHSYISRISPRGPYAQLHKLNRYISACLSSVEDCSIYWTAAYWKERELYNLVLIIGGVRGNSFEDSRFKVVLICGCLSGLSVNAVILPCHPNAMGTIIWILYNMNTTNNNSYPFVFNP